MGVICGVDPGRDGAISVVGSITGAINLPRHDGGFLDTDSIAAQLRIWSPSCVVLETPFAKAPAGLTNVLNMGKEFGRIYERLHVMGFSVVLVTPANWTKHLSQPSPSKSLSASQRTKALKAWRVNLCREMWPDLTWATTQDSRGGQADALLMAWVRSRGLI